MTSSLPETVHSPATTTTDADAPALVMRNLHVHFDTDMGVARAVRGVSLELRRGRILAVVGESGCGKSVTAYSILRLIQKPGRIANGSIVLHPRNRPQIDITALSENDEQLYEVRGGLVGMIFQEPMTALSPVHTIGNQIMEAILLHRPVTKTQARTQAIDMLGKVGIPAPEQRIDQYPHQMSGGMRQRVVIAMALACAPEVLIADEPTTALDVTIQAQILGLIKRQQRDIGCSVLLITHNMGVVAQTADEVAVMYLGCVVERGSVDEVLTNPRHPYTMGLMQSIPGAASTRKRLHSIAGSVPSLMRIPSGCTFHPRCPWARAGVCDVGAAPVLRELNGQQTACHLAEEIAAGLAPGKS